MPVKFSEGKEFSMPSNYDCGLPVPEGAGEGLFKRAGSDKGGGMALNWKRVDLD